MNLKELIKEVEELKKIIIESDIDLPHCNGKLKGIKQTVEAVDNAQFGCSSQEDTKVWWQLKELLGLK